MHPGGFSAEDTQDVQYTNQNIIINNNTSTNHNNIFIQNPLLTKKEIPKIEYMKPEAIAVVKNINNLKSAKKSSPVIISEKESAKEKESETEQKTSIKNTSSLNFSKNEKKSYSDGSLYIGEIDHETGKKNGQGKLTLSNGDSYEGEFKQDLFHGYGVYIDNASGSKYEGNWEEGSRTGKGKEYFNDGSVYEGNYLKNKRNGKGKLKLSNGSEYLGDFIDDKIEGKGIFKWNENKIYFGEWENNSLNGIGSFMLGTKKYIGHFRNDKKEGIGINYFYESNNYIIGKWVSDSIEGLAVFSSFKNGKQIWEMKDNKMVKTFCIETELDNIKQTEEFQELLIFYNYVIKSEYKDKKMKLEDKFL